MVKYRNSVYRTAFTAALLFAATDAGAAVPDSYGFGSRSSAMAGAVGADASDFSTVFYNPAGLTEAPGVALDLGYTYNFQRLRVNGENNDVDDVHGLVGGVVAPGKLWRIPFAFGLALHLPDSGISFLKARKQEVPRWELYDTRQQLLFLGAALAIRPLPWLELGGGIGYLSATRGKFGIRGRADITAPYDSQLEHEVDADLTAVRFPLAGVRFVWDGWGALGVSYRGESKLDLHLAARLQGSVAFAGIDVPLLYDLEARTINSFTPHTVTMSLSVQRIKNLHLNFDLSWINWSAYESPVAQIQANLDIRPPKGTPIQLPSAPAPTQIVPPEFRDRFAPRIGAEWRIPLGSPREVHGKSVAFCELPVRAGYSFDPSPVPEQKGVTNFIDADRHTLALGAGVSFNRPFEALPGWLRLDVHAIFSRLPARTMVKDNPADFVGDYSASGAIYGLGTTAEVAF
jgi:long-subunit fatty acid transport protein